MAWITGKMQKHNNPNKKNIIIGNTFAKQKHNGSWVDNNGNILKSKIVNLTQLLKQKKST